MSILHRQFNKVFDYIEPGSSPDMVEVLKLTSMIQIEIAEQQRRVADALAEIIARGRAGTAGVDFERYFSSVQNPQPTMRG